MTDSECPNKRPECTFEECTHDCQDYCYESSAARLATLAEHHAAKIERFALPFLCAVGIAGVVAFYLIWSMNRSVSALDQHVDIMQRTIVQMGTDVRRMSENMNDIGLATVRMADSVKSMTTQVEGIGSNINQMTLATGRMAYQLPLLVQTTGAMNQNMGRLGQDVNTMASPMRMISGFMPW